MDFFYDEYLDLERQNNNPILEEGSTGNYVIILQNKLKELGYYFASVTGSFDAYTKEAVINFQEDNQLVPNGIVNQNTWDTLYALTEASTFGINTKGQRPTLRIGDSGEAVRELQTILKNLLYYNGTIDGIFGSGTQTAVKSFQTNNKITADGIVGRNTWSALASLYSPLAICGNGNVGNNSITYTVVKGDSLYQIARRFNTTVDAIKNLNNLSSDVIQIGQKLLIPTSSNQQPTTTYIVVAGDSLYLIARKFNTTVNAIKQLNNLNSDVIQIGQKLLIP